MYKSSQGRSISVCLIVETEQTAKPSLPSVRECLWASPVAGQTFCLCGIDGIIKNHANDRVRGRLRFAFSGECARPLHRSHQFICCRRQVLRGTVTFCVAAERQPAQELIGVA